MSKRYPGGILRKTPQTPTQTSAQGIWDMASVTQAVKENNWPIAGVPDPISKSLRFRSSASAYLNRTPASAGSRTTWTMSFWMKLGSSTGFILGVPTTTNPRMQLYYTASNGVIEWYQSDASTNTVYYLIPTQVFRDPSAWYHMVIVADTTQATSSNRLKWYVNGQQITAFSTATYPAQNTLTEWNAAAVHNICRTPSGGGTGYLDCYLAEVNFVDGQALTPSSFGSTNDQTGVWQPIAYTGTYGTNGFYLPFSNTASTTTLGYDFSGNSNNWTTNNISLTSGSTYDSMVDVPTQWIPYNTAGDTGALFRGNYCTLNPLNIVSPSTISAGNLNFDTGTTGGGGVYANWNYPESGKFYHELSNLSGVGTANGRVSAANVYWESNTGDVYISGVFAANVGTWSDTSTLGFAADCGAKTIALYRNNVLLYTASAGNAMFSSPVAYAADGSGSFAISGSFNFGQRPFSYTPPSGFKTLCTTNLTTPTIGATASTTANKYFNAVTYTGTSGTQAVTGVGFQPDFVWIKNRTSTLSHVLQDAVRGTTAYLVSNATTAENTNTASNWFRSFDSDGFTVATLTSPGGVSTNEWNNTGYNYVSWNWRASNATAVTNTAGSITSTVSANTTAGFSIVTWSQGASSGTVGHGLGVAPSMIIGKTRSNSGFGWHVYHSSLGVNKYLFLNLTNGETTSSGIWSTLSSTVFGASTGLFEANQTQVAYCFAPIAGYSAFGSYTGNGSSDGPFVFTGFRPRFFMVKRTDSANDWVVLDTSRNTYNVMTSSLFPNSSSSETSNGFYDTDFLSNGFKIRATNAVVNASGGTYIYACFAEFPFKFSLAR